MHLQKKYLKKEIKMLAFDSIHEIKQEEKMDKVHLKLVFFLGFSAPLKF